MFSELDLSSVRLSLEVGDEMKGRKKKEKKKENKGIKMNIWELEKEKKKKKDDELVL